MRRRGAVAAALLASSLTFVARVAPSAAADSAAPAKVRTFALVIGVNRGSDPTATVLRYADDDAVRFRELFRTLGAETSTLTTLDENTRRVHPEATVDVQPARRPELLRAAERLAAQVAEAKRKGERAVLYFVYAGHGRVEKGGGSLALEDGALGAKDVLEVVVDRIGADQTHVVVDACHSFFLALSRGPGSGTRRAVNGFARWGALAERKDVGLPLSTSSARESHEWAAFQAGVFSQEVRSGLYGAADADADGRVSYREISAFIDRANAAIRNERFRSEVFGRPPADGEVLVDLRPALWRRIEIAASEGRHYLEDTAGTRLADFNNAGALTLVRPGTGRLYLRRVADDREVVLEAGVEVARVADLAFVEPRTSSRDAAHDAFGALFALPFARDAVAAYEPPDLDSHDVLAPTGESTNSVRPRTLLAWGLGGAGVAAGAWGIASWLDARALREGAAREMSQAEVGALNERIADRNVRGAVLLGLDAAALGSALAIALWPQRHVQIVALPGAVAGGYGGTF